jgi:hypothetical protein
MEKIENNPKTKSKQIKQIKGVGIAKKSMRTRLLLIIDENTHEVLIGISAQEKI